MEIQEQEIQKPKRVRKSGMRYQKDSPEFQRFSELYLAWVQRGKPKSHRLGTILVQEFGLPAKNYKGLWNRFVEVDSAK